MPRGWQRGALWLIVADVTDFMAILGRVPTTLRIALVVLTDGPSVPPDAAAAVHRVRCTESVGVLLAVLGMQRIIEPQQVPGARQVHTIVDQRTPRKSR